MKIRKLMVLTAMTIAFASTSVFGALADEVINENPSMDEGAAVEDLRAGWEQNTRTGDWYYYENGNMVTDRLITEVDDRGGLVYYYIGENGIMVKNMTKVLGDVEYVFDEEGAYKMPYKGAPVGTISGKTFKNTWFNMMLTFTGTRMEEFEAEDTYTDDAFATIGSPKTTLDLYIEMGDIGELQIYYLDLEKKPELDAVAFATEFEKLRQGKDIEASAVENVVVGGQTYAKFSLTKKKNVTTCYCRKQGSFMVVIETSNRVSDNAAMTAVVNEFTPAQ